jgi:hypothetical protein
MDHLACRRVPPGPDAAVDEGLEVITEGDAGILGHDENLTAK